MIQFFVSFFWKVLGQKEVNLNKSESTTELSSGGRSRRRMVVTPLGTRGVLDERVSDQPEHPNSLPNPRSEVDDPY